MLLLMFFVTGCGNKKFDLYQGSQDIKITRKSDSLPGSIFLIHIKKEEKNILFFQQI